MMKLLPQIPPHSCSLIHTPCLLLPPLCSAHLCPQPAPLCQLIGTVSLAVAAVIATHFQVVIVKPEVGRNSNAHFLQAAGSPAEHSVELPTPLGPWQEINKAPLPLQWRDPRGCIAALFPAPTKTYLGRFPPEKYENSCIKPFLPSVAYTLQGSKVYTCGAGQKWFRTPTELALSSCCLAKHLGFAHTRNCHNQKCK